MKDIFAPAPEQKEKAKHGEQMFPLQQYITELSDSYPAVTAHWHEEAEFTLIEEGSCTYQAHLQSYPVQPGDLIFYGSGKGINHVAMYIGSGLVIHASNPSDGIKISNAYYRHPVKIGRVMN